MRETRIVHVTQSISRSAGGPFESVRRLSQSVRAATGAPVTVLAPADEESAQDRASWEPLAVSTHPVVGPRGLGFSPRLARDLEAARPDLVHLHGLWRYTSVAVWRWARRTGRPYVVSPHGMLEPWALRQSRFKKWLATLVYQGPCLRRATCLRATSQMEVESIRAAGYENAIAMVPNGVAFPARLPPRADSGGTRIRRALFLSRIHPKKGVLNLVEAWNEVRPEGWELVIAGPDEGGHLAEVRRAAAGKGLAALPGGGIRFVGPVWREEKTRLYLESDVFVLPSLSENFGLVVGEALGCGVPVITTRATPWQDLEHHHCGWCIDTGVQPLVQALRVVQSMPLAHLRTMGQNGRRLVESQFAWEPIVRKMAEVYKWMLGRAERPECVLPPEPGR